MGTSDKHGARGSIILNYDWYEDSQGINEYYNNCAKIESDPKNEDFVLLKIEDGKHDFRKGHRHNTKIIKISTSLLIDLIEKNGTQI